MERERKLPAYIRPVTLSDLEQAKRTRKRDLQQPESSDRNLSPYPEELKRAEGAYIRAWRAARGSSGSTDATTHLTGLALSGGGIRSATFSLGVMQALASRSLLKKVDILSTVSGGGYIGSALTWLLSDQAQQRAAEECPEVMEQRSGEETKQHQPEFGLDANDFPFGTDAPDPTAPTEASEYQQRMLAYLRDHGRYLTPGAGINALSLLGVVIRGTFLNVTMWMPVFVLFFLFGMWFFGQYYHGDLYVIPRLMSACVPGQPGPVCSRLFGFELFLWIGLGLLILLTLLTLLYSFGTWLRRFGKSAAVADKWYRIRRFGERWVTMVLASILLLLLVGVLPAIRELLMNGWESVGPLAMLSGLGMAMREFLSTKSDTRRLPAGGLATTAAALFMFGGFLIAFDLAHWLLGKDWLYWAVLGMVLFSLLFGWFVNLNYISIHRYYRDRLMETFMPDIDKALGNETGCAEGANLARLSSFAYRDGPPRGPYHIVNTNVVLADSDKRTYRNRGGDSFMLSPLYCGSNATGWCLTKDFSDGKMTLATAVAISGAAANPNTGVGGVGITRNRLVSFVMSLLNLGLGYWAEHPNPDRSLIPQLPELKNALKLRKLLKFLRLPVLLRHAPNHFHPGLYIFGNLVDWKGFNESRAFLQLSDGGHFENTGVYELIRRQTRLIIVCDGGADADFSFSDFQTTVRRIEDDFGARIEIVEGATPNEVVPSRPARYPGGAKFANQGHMVCHILYADQTEGWMIYMKTTLIDQVSFKVKGYAAQNKDFPDQSTVDQFFDEVQFEAYRELGYRLTTRMLESELPKALEGAVSRQSEAGKRNDMEGFIRCYSI